MAIKSALKNCAFVVAQNREKTVDTAQKHVLVGLWKHEGQKARVRYAKK